jgi:Tol biopolymer transport system component
MTSKAAASRRSLRTAASISSRAFPPDGRQIVFVSTGGTGHFGLKIADLTPAGLAKERFLVSPRESRIDRYYYSSHDHFINPSWSPDGTRVWFVTNTEIPWGTGKICSVAIADAAIACLDMHQLETSWAARPEVGPDGKRILFSNYHGGQWHQLWLTTTDDAAPLPLTYGEFDRRNARWSPDGKRIAYISNEGGNTSLWVQDTFGGARAPVKPRHPSPATGSLPADPAGRRGRPARRCARFGARQRRALARAIGRAGCTATSCTTMRNFPSEVHYFHCPAECMPAKSGFPRARRRFTSRNGFRRSRC